MQYGTQVEYDFAFDQYKTKGDTSFLVAMCNSQDVTVLSGYVKSLHFNEIASIQNSTYFGRLLEMLLVPNSGILRSDFNTLFNNVANNPVGNELALDFLINRWNDIQAAWVQEQRQSFRYCVLIKVWIL